MWTPLDNKYFETFSYLPPLSDDEIAKQVDYIVNNGELLMWASIAVAAAMDAWIAQSGRHFVRDHVSNAVLVALTQASSPPWSSLRLARRTCS